MVWLLWIISRRDVGSIQKVGHISSRDTLISKEGQLWKLQQGTLHNNLQKGGVHFVPLPHGSYLYTKTI